MSWLILVSLIWAFSFGLIKTQLVGLDRSLVAFVRVALALVVFLPFLRPRGLRVRDVVKLLAIGAVQFGVMYIAYISAFDHLKASEVALWTFFTPVFVCLFDDVAARRFHLWPIVAAAIAVSGAAIVSPPAGDAWLGIALMQISNAAFAAGQVFYRRWRLVHPQIKDARVFGLLYLGAVLATLPTAFPALGTMGSFSAVQWETLLYLGLIASGLCFFLWNFGAVRTHAGPLAVANNLKIPLAVACALLVFHETVDIRRLAIGGTLVVVAAVVAEWSARRQAA